MTVDKIIIAQDSLGRLMNDLAPGSYASMTKVDFAALDHKHANPIGVYGSKSEIIRFLRDIGAIDDQVCVFICRLVTVYLPPES